MLFQQCIFLSTESEKEWTDSELTFREKLISWKRNILFPLAFSKEELKPVLASLASYRDWAALHQGAAGYLKTIARGTPYFTSDTDISSIRSQIEKRTNNAHPDLSQAVASTPSESFFRSILFLRLAHLSDQEHEALDSQLLSIDRSENILFSKLKGMKNTDIGLLEPKESADAEKSIESEKSVEPEKRRVRPDESIGHYRDRGSLMTEQRMHAWSMLLMSKLEDCINQGQPVKNLIQQDEKLIHEGKKYSHDDCRGLNEFLWVTTSPAIVNFLISVSEKSKLMLDMDNFKVHKENCMYRDQWQEAFYRSVKTAINGGNWNLDSFIPEDDCCSIFADVKLYLFSGENVKRLFYFSQQENTDSALLQSGGETVPVLQVGLKKNT